MQTKEEANHSLNFNSATNFLDTEIFGFILKELRLLLHSLMDEAMMKIIQCGLLFELSFVELSLAMLPIPRE